VVAESFELSWRHRGNGEGEWQYEQNKEISVLQKDWDCKA
jgi:hypothetical protein